MRLLMGTGWMAEQHAKQFGTIDGVELVGAVDVEQDRVAAFSDTCSWFQVGTKELAPSREPEPRTGTEPRT